jgi:hypothetical protein
MEMETGKSHELKKIKTHLTPLKRRNFTGIVQDFYKNQFIFTGKTHETEKISMF